jgi:hypothetical protein
MEYSLCMYNFYRRKRTLTDFKRKGKENQVSQGEVDMF